MGIYNDHIVPRLVTCACGTKPVLRQRQKVVPKAYGTVLDGIGAGQNLPHYTADQVDKVIVWIHALSLGSWQLSGRERRASILILFRGQPNPFRSMMLRWIRF